MTTEKKGEETALQEAEQETPEKVEEKRVEGEQEEAQEAQVEEEPEAQEEAPEEEETGELARALNADLVLADQMFYDDRDYEEALKLYRKVSEEETDETLVARALYWIGECLVKLGRMEEAIAAFESLANRFPGHHLGESAKRRCAALQSE